MSGSIGPFTYDNRGGNKEIGFYLQVSISHLLIGILLTAAIVTAWAVGKYFNGFSW